MDYVTTLLYDVGSTDVKNNGILNGSSLGVPLGSNDVLMLDYDEGIKLVSTDGELLGFTLVINVVYTIRVGEVTELVSFVRSFGGSN